MVWMSDSKQAVTLNSATQGTDLSGLSGKSIALVSTVPFFLVNQLSTHVRNLRRLGMEVTVISSPGTELEEFSDDPGIRVLPVRISRKISLWSDLLALMALFRIFRLHKFAIVHSTTPKAGLLCALASRMAGIPVRLHTFTGQVWAVKHGVKRTILKLLDKLVLSLNTHCYSDSPSQTRLIFDEGVAQPGSLSSYGSGSLAGVDTDRFSREHFNPKEMQKLRRNIGLDSGALVLAYVGRITQDKGVQELLTAFKELQIRHSGIDLLMLGPTDGESGSEIQQENAEIPNVHWLGYVRDPERYLAISDILCLPSYREGFGTVVIEAAAMEVPAVGTKIPGLVDAIEDGVTGILVPPRDADALAKALAILIESPDFLKRMKIAARERCLREFDSHLVNQHVACEYVRWLSAAGVRK